LIEGRGGVIAGCGFLVELSFLGGREKLVGYDVESLVAYG
jgi:adenine phosphoribosyltransferase